MADRQRPKKRKIPARAHLRSGLFIIPSLFTLGNIFCGYFAVISAHRGSYDNAALAIGVGAILDGLDGRIARLTKTTSDFGLELDSLADFATFGVAPAMLAFSWGLGSFDKTQGNVVHVTQLGWFATFAFVICGALRLARFNIQSQKPQETASKRYFVGLPIPAAAGLIAAYVHYFKEPILQVGSALLWDGLVTLVAVLMISTVRYNSFKQLDLRKPRPHVIFLVAALLVSAIFFYSEVSLLALTAIFAASGPVGKLIQTVRRVLHPNATHSEPAHGNIRP